MSLSSLSKRLISHKDLVLKSICSRKYNMIPMCTIQCKLNLGTQRTQFFLLLTRNFFRLVGLPFYRRSLNENRIWSFEIWAYKDFVTRFTSRKLSFRNSQEINYPSLHVIRDNYMFFIFAFYWTIFMPLSSTKRIRQPLSSSIRNCAEKQHSITPSVKRFTYKTFRKVYFDHF